MEQAINAYYKITASPEFREPERMRERARNDEASALHHAKMIGHEEGRAEGRKEGRAESRAEAIQNLMDTLNLSIEQAMSALKIPFAERSKYREAIQKQQP